MKRGMIDCGGVVLRGRVQDQHGRFPEGFRYFVADKGGTLGTLLTCRVDRIMPETGDPHPSEIHFPVGSKVRREEGETLGLVEKLWYDRMTGNWLHRVYFADYPADQRWTLKGWELVPWDTPKLQL